MYEALRDESLDELTRLGFDGYPYTEASALKGQGVMETFKLISKITAKHPIGLHEFEGTVGLDGDTVTSDAAALAKVTVTGEILEHGKGPKIHIHKFKNKTGYHKRQGHRQPLTRVKVTGIKSGK